ncbi:hypothetical protein AB0M20_09695 [Actinoplanes sp. NPDC051633]|uniref:hypothetical protein n=1 Tax=Actinoplanes sp. NPDC051633 TaxID=3155670 RepID=UPI003421FCB4
MGVLEVDGDDLAGVGASDAQALTGDHDDAIGWDAALCGLRAGFGTGQRGDGDASAAE